ncbi:MAG TPA: O-antigen ligase family protein [Ignavibacteriaceae bacterium]|nr:O-antigen ligase family protein [Ignavibacteriaceae bacterium]
MEENNKIVKIVDGLILTFMVIFLVSLTNSIFVNQLGYYGCLLLILFRGMYLKKNPFSKTGLEYAFLFFIAAELISLIFSIDPQQALHNMLKRVLIIPIVYVIVASAKNTKQGRNFFYIYIGASLVTIIIYLFFSYKYYINNLYNITGSGPSIFQYPITAGEILSFTAIFLFAFLLNEKGTLKQKGFTLALFLISCAALFSTYKRTSWLGAAFGILSIIILRKQWKILFVFGAIVALILVGSKNISEVNYYKINRNFLVKQQTIDTKGRAVSLVKNNNKILIADYENGIKETNGNELTEKLKLPSPVVTLNKLSSRYFLAQLLDTRFVLIERKTSGSMSAVKEFLSPGYTSNYSILNNNLFVLDKDSGLTIFTNIISDSTAHRYPQVTGDYIFTDSINIAVFSNGTGLNIYDKNLNKKVEGKFKKANYVFYDNGEVLVARQNRLVLFRYDSTLVKVDFNDDIQKIYNIKKENDEYLITTLNKKLYIVKNTQFKLNILHSFILDYVPADVVLTNDAIVLSNVKQSRILSIFDPYHPANAGRISFWKAGWKMFLDRPITGLGDIDLNKPFTEYKTKYDKEIQGHLHNNFIHILAVLGIIGLAAFVYLLYRMFIVNMKIYQSYGFNSPFLSSYALGTLGAFFAFIFAGLTELNFFDHEIATLLYFTFGLNFALYMLNKNKI